MNVSLTPELEKFVEIEVSSGLYQTASEVIRDSLRLLKREKDNRALRQPQTIEELEALLLTRIESLDRGEGISGEEGRQRLQKLIKIKKAEISTSK